MKVMMKSIQILVVVALLLVNLAIAPSAWADAGKLKKTPEYTEVTQSLESLVQSPEKSGLRPTEVQQKIGDLRLQKYILETAKGRAQCHNQTGKTLAIYAKSKKAAATEPSTIYYLADGQETDDDWACTGVFLPSGTKLATFPTGTQDLTTGSLYTFVPGSHVFISTNATTGGVELNVPAFKVLTTSVDGIEVPTFTQADIDTQLPNAPVD